jgi:uncharacterized protein DUF4167
MRQGPHQKRGRGRGGNNNNRRPSTPNRNQTFDSNGPDVRIRGNAHQVYEKYVTLARDASTAGDRLLAENLFQHADHYFRIYSAFNEENEAREARKNAQQDNGQQQSDNSPRNDDSRKDDENEAGNVVEARSVQPPVPQPQATSSSDEESAPARRTRSERRQDAEAAEQTGEQQASEPEQRAPRQPRRRRSAPAPQDSSPPAADNDSALRAMLGASESGAPKAAPQEASADSVEPEAKPVRRRGRPRKVVEAVEPALPLAGED